VGSREGGSAELSQTVESFEAFSVLWHSSAMQVVYSAALGLFLVLAVACFSVWLTARDERRYRETRTRAASGNCSSDSGSWPTSSDPSGCSDSSSSSCN
jgi:hypothetical protein